MIQPRIIHISSTKILQFLYIYYILSTFLILRTLQQESVEPTTYHVLDKNIIQKQFDLQNGSYVYKFPQHAHAYEISAQEIQQGKQGQIRQHVHENGSFPYCNTKGALLTTKKITDWSYDQEEINGFLTWTCDNGGKTDGGETKCYGIYPIKGEDNKVKIFLFVGKFNRNDVKNPTRNWFKTIEEVDLTKYFHKTSLAQIFIVNDGDGDKKLLLFMQSKLIVFEDLDDLSVKKSKLVKIPGAKDSYGLRIKKVERWQNYYIITYDKNIKLYKLQFLQRNQTNQNENKVLNIEIMKVFDQEYIYQMYKKSYGYEHFHPNASKPGYRKYGRFNSIKLVDSKVDLENDILYFLCHYVGVFAMQLRIAESYPVQLQIEYLPQYEHRVKNAQYIDVLRSVLFISGVDDPEEGGNDLKKSLFLQELLWYKMNGHSNPGFHLHRELRFEQNATQIVENAFKIRLFKDYAFLMSSSGAKKDGLIMKNFVYRHSIIKKPTIGNQDLIWSYSEGQLLDVEEIDSPQASHHNTEKTGKNEIPPHLYLNLRPQGVSIEQLQHHSPSFECKVEESEIESIPVQDHMFRLEFFSKDCDFKEKMLKAHPDLDPAQFLCQTEQNLWLQVIDSNRTQNYSRVDVFHQFFNDENNKSQILFAGGICLGFCFVLCSGVCLLKILKVGSKYTFSGGKKQRDDHQISIAEIDDEDTSKEDSGKNRTPQVNSLKNLYHSAQQESQLSARSNDFQLEITTSQQSNDNSNNQLPFTSEEKEHQFAFDSQKKFNAEFQQDLTEINEVDSSREEQTLSKVYNIDKDQDDDDDDDDSDGLSDDDDDDEDEDIEIGGSDDEEEEDDDDDGDEEDDDKSKSLDMSSDENEEEEDDGEDEEKEEEDQKVGQQDMKDSQAFLLSSEKEKKKGLKEGEEEEGKGSQNDDSLKEEDEDVNDEDKER